MENLKIDYDLARERLKEIIEEVFNGKQADLATKAGLSEVTISRLKQGKNNLDSADTIKKLSEASGVRPGYFFGEFNTIEEAKVDRNIPLTGDNIARASPNIEAKALLSTSATDLSPVPVISWVQAGELQEVVDPFPPGCGDRTVLTDCCDEYCFALEVVGYSMSPRFLPGDIIIVSPQTPPHSGSYVIARIMDDDGSYKATFKKLRITGEPPNETYTLTPLNREFSERVLTRDPGKHWQIIGVVVDVKMDMNAGRNGY